MNKDKIKQIESMFEYLQDKVSSCYAELNRYNELLKQNLRRVIEEKDKEISKLTAESTEFESKVYKKNDLIILQDRMIDLMSKYINEQDIDEDICSKKTDDCYEDVFDNGESCIKCIQQYFENKAKGGK